MFVDPTVTPLATQVTVAGIGVALIQWLKSSKWFPFITADSEKLNRFFGALYAVVSAVGVHLAWNHGAVPGTYMVEVSGLTLTGVLMGAWAVTKQFVLQQIIFRTTVKPTPLVPANTAQKLQPAGR